MTATMIMKSFHESVENHTILDAKVNNFIEKYEAEGYKIAMTTVNVQPATVTSSGITTLHTFVTIWMAQPAVQIPPGLVVPVRMSA